MRSFNLTGKLPIYMELADRIEEMVLDGVLEQNSQLESVREMANELAVNPNTIQKAYSELERRGVIYSLNGKGSFISNNIESIRDAKTEAITGKLEKLVFSLKKLGVGKEKILTVVDAVYCE
jgi:GntR family transcriptional regulator